jgi:hypothetical protein
MNESPYRRGFKGMVFGAFLGAGVLMPFVLLFKSSFGVSEIVPGAMSGAALGFILKAFLPRAHPVPKDLTTLTYLSISAFCLWVVADGLVKGEIHGMPSRGNFIGGFIELWSWKKNPGGFLVYLFFWVVFGLGFVGGPIWYYLKAVRESGQSDANDAPNLASLPGATALLSIYEEFRALPENTQAIVLFTVIFCSMLILLYLSFIAG